MILLRLYLEFFKAGLFAVGGGLATLPFLYAISDSTGWFSHAQLADMVAVSESTPGPIGVNMATYVGFTTAGIPGMFAATIGLVTPSVIVVLIVAQFLKKFAENKYVLSAFYGLRAASVGLIAAACFLVVKIALLNIDAFEVSHAVTDLFNLKGILLAAVLYIAMKKIDLHPVVFLAASAVVGILLRYAGV
ncbi:MAG: chromate transporter [Stomatobaculum sp.]|nr:chromate transporter [Stomatobaculum sp.]